ncbi:hypothetical protein [Acidovorax sp. Leaf160]|uniref:hypothetical protein n=1 Tax=Acidovorax sp. Leaf160 TaxID=1736280 RepID=UPI0012E3BF37|nr:hypothetical protein [Acidovorax sp. Leaf160]
MPNANASQMGKGRVKSVQQILVGDYALTAASGNLFYRDIPISAVNTAKTRLELQGGLYSTSTGGSSDVSGLIVTLLNASAVRIATRGFGVASNYRIYMSLKITEYL